MFDLRAKELKYAKELLLNHLQKIRTKFCEVAGHVGSVETVATNNLRKMFRSRIHRAGLKTMLPMQLHWAPRDGSWAGCSFLPDIPCAREL